MPKIFNKFGIPAIVSNKRALEMIHQDGATLAPLEEQPGYKAPKKGTKVEEVKPIVQVVKTIDPAVQDLEKVVKTENFEEKKSKIVAAQKEDEIKVEEDDITPA